MNWFSIIKENRLVSQNITHTKVNEDPDNKEDRCKKKLKEILTRFRNAVTYPHKRGRADDGGFLSFQNVTPTKEPVITMDIRINGQPDISGSFLDSPDALPSEEDCCVILEEMAKLGEVKMGFTNDGYTMTFHEYSGAKLPSWWDTRGSVYSSSMAFYSDKNADEVRLEDLDEEDGEPKKVARKLNVSKYLVFRTGDTPDAHETKRYEIAVTHIVDLDYSGQLEEMQMKNKWFLFPQLQCSQTMQEVEAKFSELIR